MRLPVFSLSVCSLLLIVTMFFCSSIGCIFSAGNKSALSTHARYCRSGSSGAVGAASSAFSAVDARGVGGGVGGGGGGGGAGGGGSTDEEGRSDGGEGPTGEPYVPQAADGGASGGAAPSLPCAALDTYVQAADDSIEKAAVVAAMQELARQHYASDEDGEDGVLFHVHGADASSEVAAPLPQVAAPLPPLPVAAATLRAGSKAASDADTLAFLQKPGLLPSVLFYGVLQQVRSPAHPPLPSPPPPSSPRTPRPPPSSCTLTPPPPPLTPPRLHPFLARRRVFPETGTTSSANTSLPTSPRFRLPWLPTSSSPLTPCAATSPTL